MMTLARRRGRRIIPMDLFRASALTAVVVAHDSPFAFLTLRSSRSHWRFSIVAERITPAVSSACYKRPRSGEPRGRKGSLWAPSLSVASFASSSSPTPEQIETVCGETETEETIKKSRFIGRCGHAATFEEAKSFLQRVLQRHPKARHSCWAWRGLGAEHRFSDDGEPGGTAGQPILAGIESEGLSKVIVVVTRYYGGVKLGTGGLCRAYGGAARLCLQAAGRETRTPLMRIRIKAPVDSVGGVYHAVSDCERLAEEFTADGSVIVKVAVELSLVEAVRRRIQDATRGAAEIVEDETGSFGDKGFEKFTPR